MGCINRSEITLSILQIICRKRNRHCTKSNQRDPSYLVNWKITVTIRNVTKLNSKPCLVWGEGKITVPKCSMDVLTSFAVKIFLFIPSPEKKNYNGGISDNTGP